MMASCQPDFVPDVNLLYGTWQNGTEYYRYDDHSWDYTAANGETTQANGVTWDEADDVQESEGQPFQWTLDMESLTQIHIMEMTGEGTVPKVYTVLELTKSNMVYEDIYGREYSFVKVK